MGAGTSLESLNNQKAHVKQGMENSQTMISNAQDKISRLRKIASSLETSIQSLKNIKQNIDDFEVTKAKWEGEEERNFEGKYNSYKIFLDKYDSDTSKAKEQIDADFEAAKMEKAHAETGLENLENLLTSLESDIKLAREN